ncbi:MAG: glycosyltransferase family 9 protein, partial [Cetobacterium sp.]
MIRKINRVVQDYLRPIRLSFGRYLFDRKKEQNQELLQNNRLDMSRVNSILFLRYDGKIGDMVINTMLFRDIKKHYPAIKIGVLARGAAKDIIKFNPYVDKIYDYEKGEEKTLGDEISREKYDVLVDFSEMLRVNQMKLINLCNCKVNIGLDKSDWKLFDISYNKNSNEHISYMYKNILTIFKIMNPESDYDIYSNLTIENKIKKIVSEIDGKIIVLNPYAASKHRSFNREKILEIISKILETEQNKIVFVGERTKSEEIKTIIKVLNNDRLYYPELDGILEVAELISYAKHVITPDTSIVHIAVAKKV